MVALQAKFDSAYNIPARSHSRIGPEDPMAVPFSAESREEHQTPSAKPRFRSLQSDPYALVAPALVRTMLWERTGAPWNDLKVLSLDGSSAGDAYRPFHAPEPGWLADALAALAEVDDEIAEEELPPVDEATKTEAERIIKALARHHPPAPTIYPTQDAEIALHFKAPGRTGTVVILLSGGGRADCHACIGGTSRRAHYDTSLDIPDAFVLDQLRRLTPVGASVSRTEARIFPFPMAFQTNLLSAW